MKSKHLLSLIIMLALLVPMLVLPSGASAQTTCAGAPISRLTVGGSGRVTPGLPNNVRSYPGYYGQRVGQIPGSGQFTVLDGPVCADNHAWWRVNYNGLIGWTAEGRVGDYWLEPVNGTTTTKKVYNNKTYWFSFEYPQDWSIIDNGSYLILTKGDLRLQINMWYDAQQQPSALASGLPAGTFIVNAWVYSLGQYVVQDVLVAGGRNVLAFYRPPYSGSFLEVGNLNISVRLDTTASYWTANISANSLTEVNNIVASFGPGRNQ